MLVIPAIDLLGGRTVRLLRGDYRDVTAYDADPVETARSFAAAGARRLHVVDLDAARGQGDNAAVVGALIEAAGIEVEVGGGVRTEEAVERLLEAGAAYAVVGTAAAERPAEVRTWIDRWPGRIYVGVDARDGVVATHGWEHSGSLTVPQMLELYRDAPLAGFIVTDIDRDGALQGAATEALSTVVAASAHPVVLSGGVTSAADLFAARQGGAAGVIIGRAIYEGRLTVAEALVAAG